jgi:hypothetical protein
MRRILFAVALLFGAAAVASAATVRYRTDAELIASSNRVVRGRVLDNVVERAPSGAIRTRTRLAVIEDFTGGADAILTVFERGGHLPDGPTVWIPGAPRFAPGDDVVLCLEQVAGGYRTVSMAFSAFRVGAATAGDRPLTRFGGIAVVGGRGVAPIETLRQLDGFRRTARAVPGVAARSPMSEAQAAGGGGGRGEHGRRPFDAARRRLPLAGSRQRPGDHVVSQYPVSRRRPGRDTDDQIRVGARAWTDPPTASITLAFGGTRTSRSCRARPMTIRTARAATWASA